MLNTHLSTEHQKQDSPPVLDAVRYNLNTSITEGHGGLIQ